MKKIILALACAVSVIVAKASDSAWFSGSASGTQLTATNAVWSQLDSGVEVAEDVITLDDLDTDAALTLTPTENSAPDTATKTSVNVTAYFYPNALEDLGQPTDAQTALAVAYESDESALGYYAWNGSKWVALSCETSVAAGATEVTAKIELDYYREGETKARFTIGSTVLTYTDTNKTDQIWLPLDTQSRAVSSVEFAGSGKLKSVASTVELGVASVDGVKYPTYAAAIAAADGSQIVILRESETETLGEGALTDYKASVVDDVTYLVAKVYVAQIGDTQYETLADAVAAYTTGDIIEVLVEPVGDIPAGWKIENSKLIQVGIVVEEEETTATEVTTIVAVPYSTTNLTAATLINMSNRTEVNETLVLKVYDKTTKDYNSWTYENGEWVANNVAKADAVSEETKTSKSATEVELAAGDGVWVTYNPQTPLILNGTYATGSVQKKLEAGYNLIAPPPTGAATYSVRSITSATVGDKVVIPAGTGKPPRSLTRKAENWGYWGVQNGQPVWVDVSEEADVTVPAGTGFWYISTSGDAVTL